MNANQINEEMDALSDRLTYVGPSADPAAVGAVNAALAEWQDFYWGNLEQWPVNELSLWQQRLSQLHNMLGELEASAGRAGAPVVDAQSRQGGMLDITRVAGDWPTWLKVAAGSAVALALYQAWLAWGKRKK